MLKNYLKIAFRNLLKNKLFSLINIGGMAISMASCLIISIFIYDELKFDKHIKDFQLKYRVYGEFKKDNKHFSMVPPTIGPSLTTEYPEVEYFTRFLIMNNPVLFKVGEKKLTEDKGGYADPSVFDMFSLQLLEGNQNTALKEPGTIAIDQTLKQKYFGDKPALGQTIGMGPQNLRVVAVFKDFSSHDHLQLNYFLPMEEMTKQAPERMQDWGWTNFHTYIKLKPGTNTKLLDAKLKDFVERNAREENFYIPHLMPLAKIHLHATDQLWDVAVRGNIQTVYILLATAIFILIISILNFVNLSTARAVNRVKEVGLRKVVGAFRSQIIYQFISESMVIALIALLMGGLIAVILLPSANDFTGKNIPLDTFTNPQFVLMLLVFALVIGLAAGAYPAFYISGYNPAHILVHKQSGPGGKAFMRKGLVVLQFILAFFLIISSLTVSQQFAFMRNTDMGFDKDNLVVLHLTGDMKKKLETTKALFSDHPNILNASLCYGLPGDAYAGETITDKVTNKDLGIKMLFVDHDYEETLGLEFVAGRGFSKEFSSDEREAFLLSEAATKLLGYSNPADALEHQLLWEDDNTPKVGKVVGIVKDIQLNSMREAMEPVVLHVNPGTFSTLILRIRPMEVPATLAHLEKTWKVINTNWPFEYRFLDDNYDKMYKSEEKLATLFTFFTGFTIFVACLGLFGLVVYNTSQKYKEISIRKVLGAGELSVVIQLAKNYVLLLGIAFLIAIPLSYYAAWQWLQEFVFRISLTPVLFLKAGLFITVLSLLTVGIQSYKAARANPVNGLKQ